MVEQTWETLAVKANYRPCELAVLCKVSLRTLQRHFAAHYQVTLSAWLRDFRMKQAYRRISGGESIKSVAYDLGFKQLSHFSRVFKQVHGLAPSLVTVQPRIETAPFMGKLGSIPFLPISARTPGAAVVVLS